ncbi:MAG TPA: PadR family transcriptional regulator [Thermoanaerobaculaceae bacterium]|nr:PadR family transcriptional regulator [Thermoanaerobaculaceae bacterium]
MARHNKSRYAVLGVLSWRPASGYDIRRAISGSIGNFWSESYGQIYPALREIEREGLAKRSVERSPGKPERHVYTITDAGRSELRRWLGRPCDAHIYRVEVLIKLFFGEQVPLESSLAHIARYRAEHEALVARYRAIRQRLVREFADDPRLPFWLLTVDCGLRVGKAYTDWCDSAVEQLRRLAALGRGEKKRRVAARRGRVGRAEENRLKPLSRGTSNRTGRRGGHR